MLMTATTVAIRHTAVIPSLPDGARSSLRLVDGAAQPSACDLCRLTAVCLPDGLSLSERSEFTAMIAQYRKIKAAEVLYRAGEPFTHLYSVKTGVFKTVVLLDDGREQITGFRLPGDTLGVDAISYSVHASNAVALEDARVCAIPFTRLSRMSRQSAPVQNHLHRLLAREVIGDQDLMLLLGRMHAEERLAAFLLNLSRRYEARGQSHSEFTLAMAREDIGNYLGLTLETVSRCFSRLKAAGLIEIDNRHVHILQHEGLRRVIGARQTALTF